ncbi:hypothetical protein BpHYR1_027941 [Brachionus plicatilis]|uniref:Uncharacterized protein n=1 Tax=Brachionus plicatilis TaxID=10195 RepID=A0A3M7P2K4_BRAPC|nr:hypothetical protein BpHYR1_027941 [Brachionus plicatilis]
MNVTVQKMNPILSKLHSLKKHMLLKLQKTGLLFPWTSTPYFSDWFRLKSLLQSSKKLKNIIRKRFGIILSNVGSNHFFKISTEKSTYMNNENAKQKMIKLIIIFGCVDFILILFFNQKNDQA